MYMKDIRMNICINALCDFPSARLDIHIAYVCGWLRNTNDIYKHIQNDRNTGQVNNAKNLINSFKRIAYHIHDDFTQAQVNKKFYFLK